MIGTQCLISVANKNCNCTVHNCNYYKKCLISVLPVHKSDLCLDRNKLVIKLLFPVSNFVQPEVSDIRIKMRNHFIITEAVLHAKKISILL